MNIYFYSGSHWDREWYLSFQGFRFKLVRMLDGVIEGLETCEDYGVFHLDGHTVMIEDYLAIRPEMKDRFTNLIKKGKIVIGPWYDMPDEMLLSGESLIRNLQRGFKKSREYGVEPLKYGYVCDVFGHVAQLPQILKGMGIDGALVGRGTNEHTTPMHFNWQSPDGSSVITFKERDDHGYSAFYATSHREGDTDETIKENVLFEKERSNVPVLLMMDTYDHQEFQPNTGECIRRIKEMFPDANVYHTAVTDMVEDLKQYELPTICGELYETGKKPGGYLYVINHVLSSHYPLKKKNDRLQMLLEKWADPLCAFSLVNCADGFCDLAEEYLLKNQCHDSMCGCSVDQVHKDMHYRFDQGSVICEEIISDYEVSNKSIEGDRMFVKIFNPLPYKSTRNIETEIFFENGYKYEFADPYGYEYIKCFELVDANGNVIPYQINEIKTNQKKRVRNQWVKTGSLYKISFEAELMPFGVTVFEIAGREKAVRNFNTMKYVQNGGENEYISFKVEADGTLTMTDKIKNRTYTGLLSVIDDSEIGDGWYHASCVNDRIVSQKLKSVERLKTGVNATKIKVIHELSIAKNIDRALAGIGRNEETVSLLVEHIVTLYKNAKELDIKTVVHNNVTDHRLRLHFATGEECEQYRVNQAFCFVERNAGIKEETHDWKEPDVLEKQMGGIVRVNDLAFVSESGLHECGVDRDGNLFITLLRSFSKTPMRNDESFGQIQGEHEYHYKLVPVDDTVGDTYLLKMQDEMLASHHAFVSNEDEMPQNSSHFTLESENVIYSTAKKANSAINIRVYNPTDTLDEAILTFDKDIKSACLVNLDDKVVGDVETVDVKRVKVKLSPWKFETVRIKF